MLSFDFLCTTILSNIDNDKFRRRKMNPFAVLLILLCVAPIVAAVVNNGRRLQKVRNAFLGMRLRALTGEAVVSLGDLLMSPVTERAVSATAAIVLGGYFDHSIKSLKTDNKELKTELNADNKELKATMDARFDAVINEMKADNKEMKADNRELKADNRELKGIMLGAIFGGAAVMVSGTVLRAARAGVSPPDL